LTKKIASKAIANKIKTKLPTIISPDQTGFIKGRYIGENIRNLHETIDYINNLNEKVLIFFSDLKKAFDSLNHNFMRKCLLKFKFPNYIINWVDIFYNDAKSCIHNNGHLSSVFKISREYARDAPYRLMIYYMYRISLK